MTKILYANGCSWTAGNGINEDPKFVGPVSVENLKSHAWPNELAKKLNIDKVINKAVGGGSNKRILRTTIDFVLNFPKEQYADLIIVLGLTTLERGEVFIDNSKQPGWYRYNAMQKFSSNYDQLAFIEKYVADDIDLHQELYLKHMYNHRINIMEYFHQVFLLSNLLENLNIKYIISNSISLHYMGNRVDDASYYLENLEKIKKPAIIRDESFSEYCRKNNLPISSCIHPMIDAHKSWGNYLHQRIIDIYGEV